MLPENSGDNALISIGAELGAAIDTVENVVKWIIEMEQTDPRLPSAASVRYLMMWGTLCGAWQSVASALAANAQLNAADNVDETFLRAKIATATFYIQHVLPQVDALARVITDGSASVFAIEAAAL